MDIWERVLSRSNTLDLDKLLADRGFLTYLCRTYPAISVWLKGYHITIDSWRPGRDEDGWKLPVKKNHGHIELMGREVEL